MKLQLPDLLHLSLRALGTNKLRSGLSILGITIGVFSVVGVMTALSAIRQNIDSGLSVLAANVFQVSKYPAIRFRGNWSNWHKRPNITPDQGLEFAGRMEESGVIVTLLAEDGGERVRFEDRMTPSNKTVVGTNGNFLLTNKYDLAYGRNLTPSDLEFNRPVIVLGHDIADRLFPDRDALGRTVVADDDRYTVVGVLAQRGKLFGKAMDDLALIPLTRFVENNWHRWRSLEMAVMAPSTAAMDEVQDVAIGHLRRVRGLEPGEENDFELFSNESLRAAFAEIAAAVSTGGLLVSAIALLCAGVGIMNIMLVSVTERTREIGLRKSVGARRRDILLQFLFEAVGLCLLGGLFGILLGVLAGNFVAAFMKVPMILPWPWIAAGLAACSAVGVGFGFFPSIHAARMKPVDALRYE